MKLIKINNLTYPVPTSLMDLNLDTFLKLKDLEAHKDQMNVIEFNVEYLHVITGIKKEEILKLEAIDYATILRDIFQSIKTEMKLVEEPIFQYKGEYYVLDKAFDKMSIGQFVDLDNLTKDGDAWDKADKIAATFIRKAKPKHRIRRFFKKPLKTSDFKVDKYDFDVRDDNAKIFKEFMPLPLIYTCVVFFWKIEKELKDYIQVFSQNLEKKTV